ncbi:MAG: hypothetical protein QGG19_18170 [Alphaproteobacteria bacterium]|nr:hypothetical protein [Alphaproteobacteria bacterium]MDP6253157.1 hypothetical protein [Alphaproteobacteria bacterium]MDP7229017.1 hypothetical protein [Alphaproteobacteria bacterium]MDP7461213.1 hypothetical protein [Alphaproteobacteria bacterium]MEE1557036.1 hypothetical protein [Alphaproteobacteria bacterium]
MIFEHAVFLGHDMGAGHAGQERSMRFCIFNSVAIGAQHARAPMV